jgi:hypothetical protein
MKAGSIKMILSLTLACSLWVSVLAQMNNSMMGVWGKEENGVKTLALITDQLISLAVYNENEKQFLYTWGGKYELQGEQLQIQYEWHSKDSNLVNNTSLFPVRFQKRHSQISIGNELSGLRALGKNNTGDLQGTWIISGNYADGAVRKRSNPFYPRRTMKIIVGDYFQWVSYNVVTKKFFDAGGGKQSHGNGQYSEQIAYFTKTAASVGKQLSYSYQLDGDDWRHTGKKSTGGLLDECWTRRSRIEEIFPPVIIGSPK